MLNRLNLQRQHNFFEALVFALLAWLVVLLGSLALSAPAVVYFSSIFEATGQQPYFYGVVATHAVCAVFSVLTSVFATQARNRRFVGLAVLISVVGFVLSSRFGSPAAVLAPTLICLLPTRKEC